MRVPCLHKLQDSKTAVVVFAALVVLVLSPEEEEEEEEKQLSVMSLLRMILATSLSSTCPISVSLIASALASPAEYSAFSLHLFCTPTRNCMRFEFVRLSIEFGVAFVCFSG